VGKRYCPNEPADTVAFDGPQVTVLSPDKLKINAVVHMTDSGQSLQKESCTLTWPATAGRQAPWAKACFHHANRCGRHHQAVIFSSRRPHGASARLE
jgi:hypothetical protein